MSSKLMASMNYFDSYKSYKRYMSYYVKRKAVIMENASCFKYTPLCSYVQSDKYPK